MTFQVQHPQKTIPLDWDAGLREKTLALISDPASSVVAFPARRAPKTRHGVKTKAQIALIPKPHDPRQTSGLRLVMRRRSRQGAATLSFTKTVLGSVAIGLAIGAVTVQDRLLALVPTSDPVARFASLQPSIDVGQTQTAMASTAVLPAIPTP
jgi:hypothetical protein